MRAAHSLYRAGWILEEINGVLNNGCISAESFQIIRQQVTNLDRLQRKFAPPSPVSPSFSDIQPAHVNTKRRLTIRVMNRGFEEAAAVLSHHGWTGAQIRHVLKSAIPPFEGASFSRINSVPIEQNQFSRYLYSRSFGPAPKNRTSVFKTLFAMFWFGALIFLGVSLMLHML